MDRQMGNLIPESASPFAVASDQVVLRDCAEQPHVPIRPIYRLDYFHYNTLAAGMPDGRQHILQIFFIYKEDMEGIPS